MRLSVPFHAFSVPSHRSGGTCIILNLFRRLCVSQCFIFIIDITRNVPKFSDRQVWANSADPDQTVSDQGLHCLQFRLHLLDAIL